MQNYCLLYILIISLKKLYIYKLTFIFSYIFIIFSNFHTMDDIWVFFFFLKGTPEFVTVSECVHYFEWRTYAACRRDKFKPHKEVSKGDETWWQFC